MTCRTITCNNVTCRTNDVTCHTNNVSISIWDSIISATTCTVNCAGADAAAGGVLISAKLIGLFVGNATCHELFAQERTLLKAVCLPQKMYLIDPRLHNAS